MKKVYPVRVSSGTIERLKTKKTDRGISISRQLEDGVLVADSLLVDSAVLDFLNSDTNPDTRKALEEMGFGWVYNFRDRWQNLQKQIKNEK